MEDGGKGPDPSVFEGAFVIEDDSEDPSRAGTPAPPELKGEKMSENGTNEETPRDSEAGVVSEKVDSAPKPPAIAELPPDVRTKLRKLEKLEARYQGTLEYSRSNHAKAYILSRTSPLIPYRSRSGRINRAFRKDFEREHPLADYQ